jgi:hypothetical protein
MTAAIQALQARWDAFHAKFRDRVAEILAEARPGCLAVFEQGDFDPYTMSNVLPAVKRRLMDLVGTAEDAWFAQVDPAFHKAGSTREITEGEYAKLTVLRHWADARYEEFEIRLHADASRILWARLGSKIPMQRNCTQCGNPVALPNAFVVVNVTCFSCKSVNTFDPGPACILDAYAIRHLAHEEVWETKENEEVLPKPERLRATSTYQAEMEAWQRRYGLLAYPVQTPY